MKKERLFIAVTLSAELQQEIIAWADRFKAQLPAVRWLAPENLHITIVPPFYAEPEKIIQLIAANDEPKSVGSFKLQFNTVEFGPTPKKPRLVWVSGPAPAEITQLKKIVSKGLNQPEEKREYSLHLTLARFRPEAFAGFPLKDLHEAVDWSDEANSFSLMRSQLLRTGAVYTELKKFQL